MHIQIDVLKLLYRSEFIIFTNTYISCMHLTHSSGMHWKLIHNQIELHIIVHCRCAASTQDHQKEKFALLVYHIIQKYLLSIRCEWFSPILITATPTTTTRKERKRITTSQLWVENSLTHRSYEIVKYEVYGGGTKAQNVIFVLTQNLLVKVTSN